MSTQHLAFLDELSKLGATRYGKELAKEFKQEGFTGDAQGPVARGMAEGIESGKIPATTQRRSLKYLGHGADTDANAVMHSRGGKPGFHVALTPATSPGQVPPHVSDVKKRMLGEYNNLVDVHNAYQGDPVLQDLVNVPGPVAFEPHGKTPRVVMEGANLGKGGHTAEKGGDVLNAMQRLYQKHDMGHFDVHTGNVGYQTPKPTLIDFGRTLQGDALEPVKSNIRGMGFDPKTHDLRGEIAHGPLAAGPNPARKSYWQSDALRAAERNMSIADLGKDVGQLSHTPTPHGTLDQAAEAAETLSPLKQRMEEAIAQGRVRRPASAPAQAGWMTRGGEELAQAGKNLRGWGGQLGSFARRARAKLPSMPNVLPSFGSLKLR